MCWTADWHHSESDPVHTVNWRVTSFHVCMKTHPVFMIWWSGDPVIWWSSSPADSSGVQTHGCGSARPLRRSVSEPSTRHLHCPHRLMAEILNDNVFKSYEYEARQSRPIHISLQNILLALWALCCSRRLLLTSIIQPWWAGFPGPN